METVFQICLSNTIVALALAAGAVVPGAVGRRPALVHGLWVLVLIKLVTPPLVRLPLSNSPVVASSRPARAQTVVDPAAPTSAARERHYPAADWTVGHGSGAGTSGESASAVARPGNVLTTVASRIPSSSYGLAFFAWLGIAAFWWGFTTRRVRKFNRLLRWARLAPEDAQDQARELAPRLGLRRAPEVWLVPAPISPMLWALGPRPRLLVPESFWDRLGTDERAALLVHEMAHLRRRDHWVRLLEIGVAGLYWWNPLVWWARRCLRDAEERCCDAWVVLTFPDRTRAYASAILETLDCLADAPALEPIGGTGLASASQVKRRLIEILFGATPQHLGPLATAAFLGVAATALMLGPAYASPPSYKAMDLGSLGGQTVTGFRLNDRGQVAGWATVGDGPSDRSGRKFAVHPFRTAPDRPIDPATDDLARLIGDKAPADVQHLFAFHRGEDDRPEYLRRARIRLGAGLCPGHQRARPDRGRGAGRIGSWKPVHAACVPAHAGARARTSVHADWRRLGHGLGTCLETSPGRARDGAPSPRSRRL